MKSIIVLTSERHVTSARIHKILSSHCDEVLHMRVNQDLKSVSQRTRPSINSAKVHNFERHIFHLNMTLVRILLRKA
jgi:hypothetical protein